MVKLPALSAAAARALKLSWVELTDAHGLDGTHFQSHVRERDRLRRIAAQSEKSGGATDKDAWFRPCLDTTIRLVEERFNQLVEIYWEQWLRSKTPNEIFLAWLAEIQTLVIGDTESLWVGGPKDVEVWYGGTCRPAVEKEIARLVKEHGSRARRAELHRLETQTARRTLSPATAQSSELGMPVELHGPSEPSEAEILQALIAKPYEYAFAEWFESRRVFLATMVRNHNPRIHTIEENEVGAMATLSAVRMLDERSEAIYHRFVRSPNALQEALDLRRAEVFDEVMSPWITASELLRTWSIAHIQFGVNRGLADQVCKWMHRAARARIVQALIPYGPASLLAVIVRVENLSTQWSQDEVAPSKGSATVWVAKTGEFSFSNIGSGLFQERLLSVARDLGTLMGATSNPDKFCLRALFCELAFEYRPLSDPDVVRLSDDQLWRYLNTSLSGDSLIPSSGYVENLCEALEWYCRRLLGILNQSGRLGSAFHETADTGASHPARGTRPTAKTKASRQELVKTARGDRSMADFARHVGKSSTAIYGMINGDKTRFTAATLREFLDKIGSTLEAWNA